MNSFQRNFEYFLSKKKLSNLRKLEKSNYFGYEKEKSRSGENLKA